MNAEAMIEVERLHRIEGEGKLKGFADVAIANALSLKGFRIISGRNGLFVSMPSKPGKDGKWYETVRPKTSELRERISEVILSAYKG